MPAIRYKKKIQCIHFALHLTRIQNVSKVIHTYISKCGCIRRYSTIGVVTGGEGRGAWAP